MNNATPVKTIKVEKLELIEGEYEGYKYYKLRATTDSQIVLQAKLTAFEFKTLKEKEEKTGAGR